MWYTILITLVVDFGGLLIVYLVLRDRVRRASSTESRIAEIREEVSRLLVELNQATDRNIALMEDKITALNEAISTADKKIGLLRRETEKHDVGSQIYSRLAEGRLPRAGVSPAERPAVERAAAERAAAEFRGAESVESRGAESVESRGAEAADYRGAEPAGAQPAARRRAEPAAPRGAPAAPPLAVELSERAQSAESVESRGAAGDVRERVMMLSRAGFSPSLIASRVGVPLGEVELIISLEQRKGQA